MDEAGIQGKLCSEMYVDINGDKLPNTVGKDIFSFDIMNTRIWTKGANWSSCNTTGTSCTGYYFRTQ